MLDQTLRLLHPFIPYVTEELWQHLPHPEGEAPALIVAAWPEPHPAYDAPDAAASFERLTEACAPSATPAANTTWTLAAKSPPASTLPAICRLPDHDAGPRSLARLDPDQLTFGPAPADLKGITLVAGEITIFLPWVDSSTWTPSANACGSNWPRRKSI